MIPATANVAPGWYGAFELKRTYQRNMSLGVLYAALFHLAIIGGMLIYQYIKSRDDFSNAQVVVIKTISDVAPPPSMTAAKPQVNVAEPNIVPPKIGIPTPVPDEEVVEDVKFATRAELAELQTPIVAAGNGGNDSVVVDIPLEEYFPSPGEFVAFEEMPVAIKAVQPDYPAVARLTKQEATVTVEALVDKEGRVRDVKIVKGSGSNIGFDEAAQEAAFKCLYKPAVQNGHPIAIWVTYQVKFKLNN